jgi:arylsulfatase A-like enzyme
MWETTPYANDMLEQFAEQTLEHENLGHHEGTDLLTVSFSANDHLGHQVGPDAPEVEDMSVRTDLAIAKLLAAAEKQAGGKEHRVVVLSADHGVVAVPEVSIANKLPGGRADKTQYTKTVSDALETRFGAGNWIIGGWENGFYLNYDLIREKKIKESDVEAEAAHAVSQLPYVERVYTRTELMHRQAMASTIDDYVARSFFPERGPDVYVVLKPYWLMGGGSGTSHGSPYNYDTHVPLIFFGEDIKPGVYTDRVGISDVAPTLAAYLHIQQPSGSVGHVLAPVVQTHLGSRSSQ